MVKVLVGSRALQRHGYKVVPSDWNFWWDQEVAGTGFCIFQPHEQKLFDLARTRGGFVPTEFGMAILPSLSVLKAIYLYHYEVKFSLAYEKRQELLKWISLDNPLLQAIQEASVGFLK